MHVPLPSTLGPEPATGIVGSNPQEIGAAKIESGADPKADSRIGVLLQQAGKLTADNAERVARAQPELGLRFGEAAMRLGLVNQNDVDAAIARQFAYPMAAHGDSAFSPRLVAAFHPAGAQGDTLRAIRSQLLLRWFGTGNHALAVSGVGQGDASSVLAANLALVFAQLGQRTVLVDANLRQGCQRALFGLHAHGAAPGPASPGANQAATRGTGIAPVHADVRIPDAVRGHQLHSDQVWPGQALSGLADILAGRAGLDAIVQVPGFSTLSLLTSGTVPPNPQELLERARFGALHAELGKRYDVVLYDIAPTSHGAEALAVAAHAGAALLVALKDCTPLHALKRLAQQMTAARVAVIGSVLVEA